MHMGGRRPLKRNDCSCCCSYCHCCCVVVFVVLWCFVMFLVEDIGEEIFGGLLSSSLTRQGSTNPLSVGQNEVTTIPLSRIAAQVELQLQPTAPPSFCRSKSPTINRPSPEKQNADLHFKEVPPRIRRKYCWLQIS